MPLSPHPFSKRAFTAGLFLSLAAGGILVVLALVFGGVEATPLIDHPEAREEPLHLIGSTHRTTHAIPIPPIHELTEFPAALHTTETINRHIPSLFRFSRGCPWIRFAQSIQVYQLDFGVQPRKPQTFKALLLRGINEEVFEIGRF
jgi:hypothetical protein